MPIYEYECSHCGHYMEALQKISDAPLTECPECHRPTLKRLISAPSFRLKGGGWYETDFKSGNKRNLAESGDKPAAEGKDKKPPKEGKEKPAAEPAKAAPAKPTEGKSVTKPAKAAKTE